jgi:hypothetical protein
MQPTLVADAEDLYRAISAGKGFLFKDGKYVFSQSAFDDRLRQPSVDRSSIRVVVAEAKLTPTDGVTAVKAEDVRKSCKVPILDPKGKPTGEYAVDVLHRPILAPEPENLAHCQIESNPVYANDSRFRKLKEALARLATQNGFIIVPT